MQVKSERLWRRAQAYLANNQPTAAQVVLESLLKREPAHIQAHLVLGGIAWKEGRIRDATRHAQDAAQALPTNNPDPDLLCDVIAALSQAGEIVTARQLLSHPVLTKSKAARVLMRLSGQRQILGDHPMALEYLNRAAAAGVTGADFHCFRGVQLAFNGQLEAAETELSRCLSPDADKTVGRAALMLARLHKQTSDKNHLEQIAQHVHRVAKGSEDHASLEFALYKELEDLGRYDEAWNALARANGIMHSRLRHNSERERRLLGDLLECCSADFVRADHQHEGPQPIFVLGLPRSGTTLVDRILGNHSRITSAGELGDFGRQLCWMTDHYSLPLPDAAMLARIRGLDFGELGRRYLAQSQWRAGDKPYYLDKLPANWPLTGLIHKALPQARIIHVTRDPMDVCFSNFRAMFGTSYPYSYDLNCLAAHYLAYRRVMSHWHAILPDHVLHVAYADLVEDTENVAREILSFCDLAYEPESIDLTRNRSAVATLSMAQVREPIHRRSFGEWRNYEAHLLALQNALEAGDSQ